MSGWKKVAIGGVAAFPLLVAACAASNAETQTPTYVTDVLAGAQSGEGHRRSIVIAAASDLRLALEAIKPSLEQRCGAEITVTYGSSGQFSRQIQAGAPFDLFLSADSAFTDALAAAGRTPQGGMARYASGRIALVVRPGLVIPPSLSGITAREYSRVAIGNPERAPYGRAAREALERAGVLGAIEGRLVTAEDVRQALEYVDAGNADAGIVALSLLANRPATSYLPLDPTLHEPLDHAGAVIAGTGAEHTARCVLQAILSEQEQHQLRSFGFDPPLTHTP